MMNNISLDRKTKNIIVFAVIVVILIPIIFNFSFFSWSSRFANGSLDTWISSLATYFGAIIGGIISGTLTLIGVRLTIKSTMESLNKNIEEQKIIREEELLIQSNKERLKNLYIPVNMYLNILEHKHGSHDFTDLSFEEQIEFMKLINNNLYYADSKLNTRALEINWILKEYKPEDFGLLNDHYFEISKLCIEEMDKLREQLKLPSI